MISLLPWLVVTVVAAVRLAVVAVVVAAAGRRREHDVEHVGEHEQDEEQDDAEALDVRDDLNDRQDKLREVRVQQLDVADHFEPDGKTPKKSAGDGPRNPKTPKPRQSKK